MSEKREHVEEKRVTCDPEFMLEHENRITENTQRSLNTAERVSRLEEHFELLIEMNANIKIIAIESKHHGQLISDAVASIANTQKEVDSLRDKMETKEKVGDLEDALEHLEDIIKVQDIKIQDLEDKPAHEALATIQTMKKWVIGLAGTTVTAVVVAATLYFLHLN